MNVISKECPHCGHRAYVRSSRFLSRTLRELSFQCRNLYCSHSWLSNLEDVRTLSPSSVPHPDVSLPMSARENLERLIAIAESDPCQTSFAYDDE
jgi:hypothetical protein